MAAVVAEVEISVEAVIPTEVVETIENKQIVWLEVAVGLQPASSYTRTHEAARLFSQWIVFLVSL